MKLGQAGLGLVQVMVAIGAVAAGTYAILQNNQISSKQQVKASFDQVLEAKTEEMQTVLAKLENCTATMAGKTFSTTTQPLDGLFQGAFDATDLTKVIKGSKIFDIKQSNSQGVYVNSMTFLNRPEIDPVTRTVIGNNDVIRVQFNSGDVNAAGASRDRAKGLGATQIARDFIIQSTKDATGKVITCFSDSYNIVENSCESVADTVWNPTTKKCEFPNAIKKEELVQLWITKDGSLAYHKPADVENGEVTCQKSGKRCSRTNAECSLPSCPANHYQGGAWEWDRKQSMWDYACMKSAKCMYMAQPAGKIVKP